MIYQRILYHVGVGVEACEIIVFAKIRKHFVLKCIKSASVKFIVRLAVCIHSPVTLLHGKKEQYSAVILAPAVAIHSEIGLGVFPRVRISYAFDGEYNDVAFRPFGKVIEPCLKCGLLVIVKYVGIVNYVKRRLGCPEGEGGKCQCQNKYNNK